MNRGWKLGIVVCFLSMLLAYGPALAAEKPAKPIKVGVLFVMSGPMGGYGKHGSQAEQLCRTPEGLRAVQEGYEKRMKEAKK